jgi:hypothetical protein
LIWIEFSSISHSVILIDSKVEHLIQQALEKQRAEFEKELGNLREELLQSQNSERQALASLQKLKSAKSDDSNDSALLERISTLESQLRERNAAERVARTKDNEKIDAQSAEVGSDTLISHRIQCLQSVFNMLWNLSD